MNEQAQQGLLRTYHQPYRRRAWSAWILAALLLIFYIDLYQFDHLQPLAEALGLKNKWYLYGALYSLAMTAGAIVYLRKHGNSRYNRVRIAVNLLVQYVFAFTIPFVMLLLTHRDYYFSYLWPLKIEYFYPNTILDFPIWIIVYSIAGSLIAVPILTLMYGKRWYCSWVCGCGALANTFGDPWRHLSDKSARAWKIERVTVHSMLVIAIGATAVVVANWAIGKDHPGFSSFAFDVQSAYGFAVGFILAGAVGVGFYPLMGTRVWCRFFCPMAALLGLIQKLGRFRIKVKDDMCISCGNCSTYCEMGIDVRAYAQANQSFTRAACVGCGMCAHVCPRGVLKLEQVWPRKKQPRRLPLH